MSKEARVARVHPFSLGPQARFSGDMGFTVVEMAVVLSLMAIVGTFALTAYSGYAKVQAHRSAVRDVVAVLRNMEIRAVAEATAHQCRFDTTSVPNTLKVYRGSANPPVSTSLVKTYSLDKALRFGSISFTHADPGFPSTACLFFARGSASTGSFKITRTSSTKTYQINVEGLTARVSYEGA